MRYVLVALAMMVGCATGPTPAQLAAQQQAAELERQADALAAEARTKTAFMIARCQEVDRDPDAGAERIRNCAEFRAWLALENEAHRREEERHYRQQEIAARHRQAAAMERQAQAAELQTVQTILNNSLLAPAPAAPPAPVAPPRPVNCTTTAIGSTAYTNCY